TFADLDAVAVTEVPGLAGALLVGITYAKALSFGLEKPLISVNHLEGHIHAVLMETRESASAAMELPLLALVVSGGHTHLYLARQHATGNTWNYRNVGRTVDDAAGEAYDKVAKLLGLGYPGGPWIDALSPFGNPREVPFAFAQIKTKLHLGGRAPRTKAARTAPIADLDPRFLFSFSGIKTAVLRYVELHHLRSEAEARATRLFTGADRPERPSVEAARAACSQPTLDLIASFQYAVVGDLLKKTFAAAEALAARRILVAGGAAANRGLRQRFTAQGARRGVSVSFPSLALSTANRAMIAAPEWPRLAT